MQLILLTLLFLQGCLQKGDKHEIASNDSYKYYFNLYADDFTTATVGIEQKTNIVSYCGSDTRIKGGCSQLFDEALHTKITNISFTKDTPSQLDRDELRNEVKVTNQLTAKVNFTFMRDNKTYNCTVKDIIFGAVKQFDIGKDCTDESSIYIGVIYSEQKDLAANLRCTLSSGGIKKSITVRTANVVHRHGYVTLPSSEGDVFGVECKLERVGEKTLEVSKNSSNNPDLLDNSICVKVDGDKLTIDHANENCAFKFFKTTTLNIVYQALNALSERWDKGERPSEDTNLKNIRVVSLHKKGNVSCDIHCDNDPSAGSMSTWPTYIQDNSINLQDYFGVARVCNRDNYKNKLLEELPNVARISCKKKSDNNPVETPLTTDIVKADKNHCFYPSTDSESCLVEISFRVRETN